MDSSPSHPIRNLLSNHSFVFPSTFALPLSQPQALPQPLPSEQVFLINGIGIDVEKYSWDEKLREAKRREFGASDDVFLLLSVGELTKRKNHQVVIRALKQLEGMGICRVI